jgi:hypothetical protein
MLHGSGVVCGLELRGEKQKKNLTVTRGFALDCSGNEIWVPQDVPVDICSLLPPPQKGKGPCEEIEEDKPRGYYIGIRYQEKETNPVSVYLPSGSCEERSCENSRIKEGYCIEIVDCCLHEEKKDGVLKGLCDCKNGKKLEVDGEKRICRDCDSLKPEDNATPEQEEAWCECVVFEQFCEQSPPCAECCCCDHPCFVVLGRIELDEQCRLVSICNNDCRKYVLTPHLLRHMLIGVFNGFEQNVNFTADGQPVALPTATVLADNPVKALCWVLDNVVAKKPKAEIKDCGKKEPPKQEPKPAADVTEHLNKIDRYISQLNEKVVLLQRQVTGVTTDVNDVRVDNLIKRQQDASDKKTKK